jgi:hypothetical protein
MTSTNSASPLLLELGQEAWQEQINRVESWLGNTLMLQATFRQLAEDTVDKVIEPHIKSYLGDIAAVAKEHEQKAEELYRVIGRQPTHLRKVSGAVLSKAEEALAAVQGLAGGAVGGWQELRQLLVANLNAMGAFAIAEQLGLALGLPEIPAVTFPVVNEKSTQQLLLQEYMLEMAAKSILYKANI